MRTCTPPRCCSGNSIWARVNGPGLPVQCSSRRFDHTLNKLMFTLDTESMRHKQCSPFSVCLNRTNIYQHFHLLSSKSVWLGIWLDSFHLGHTTNHVWKLIPNPMAAIARVVSPRWNGSSWMDGWLAGTWLAVQSVFTRGPIWFHASQGRVGACTRITLPWPVHSTAMTLVHCTRLVSLFVVNFNIF